MHRDLQPAARLDRGGDGGNVGERAAGQQRVQQHRHQDEGRAAGQAAAAGQQQGAEQRAAEEAQEGQADVAEEIAGSLEALGEFPVDGVVLPKVRLCCRSLLAPLPFIATSQACGEEQARQACCSAVVPQVCLPSHRTVKLNSASMLPRLTPHAIACTLFAAEPHCNRGTLPASAAALVRRVCHPRRRLPALLAGTALLRPPAEAGCVQHGSHRCVGRAALGLAPGQPPGLQIATLPKSACLQLLLPPTLARRTRTGGAASSQAGPAPPCAILQRRPGEQRQRAVEPTGGGGGRHASLARAQHDWHTGVRRGREGRPRFAAALGRVCHGELCL